MKAMLDMKFFVQSSYTTEHVLCTRRQSQARFLHPQEKAKFFHCHWYAESSLWLLNKLIMTLSFTELIGENSNIPLHYARKEVGSKQRLKS